MSSPHHHILILPYSRDCTRYHKQMFFCAAVRPLIAHIYLHCRRRLSHCTDHCRVSKPFADSLSAGNADLITLLSCDATWWPALRVGPPSPPTLLHTTVVFPQLKTNCNLFILYKHPRAKFSWLIYSTNSYSCDLLPALHLSLHSSQAREDRQKDCSLIMKTDNLRRACAVSYVLVFFRFSFTQCVVLLLLLFCQ